MRFQIANAAPLIVLGTFDGLPDGAIPSGNQSDEQPADPEGGRNLTGIEDAEPATGARTEVEDAPARLHTLKGHPDDRTDLVRQPGNGFSSFTIAYGHGRSDVLRGHVLKSVPAAGLFSGGEGILHGR